METKWGIPIVSADNIFSELDNLGIKPWQTTGPIVDLDTYRQGGLTKAQQDELRFAPIIQVVPLVTPGGNLFTGFRTKTKDWTTTFILLHGNLVPIIAEWKHGADSISLAPPSGVIKSEEELTAECAQREFQEETGLLLSGIVPLHEGGIAVSSRSSTQRYYPFLGTVQEPIDRGSARLDENEHLQIVLFPLDEWLKLINRGQVIDDCAICTTVLALMRLKKLVAQ